MNNQLKHTSKFISLVLRHQPEVIGLELDEHGWASTSELIYKLQQKGEQIDDAILDEIVNTNDKQRFIFNEDKSMVRANQGHSLEVDLQLEPITPPGFLYHGTADRFVQQILREGLKKQQRQHLHLSIDKETAMNVGRRHGKPILLTIAALAMHEDGYQFYLSENGVWLTAEVPPTYLHVF